MKGSARIVLALLLAAAPAASTAQNLPTRVTAGQLLKICDENRAACLTYVMGAIDGVVATTVANSRKHPLCIPVRITNQQIAEAAASYIRAHPEDATNNAATVVIVGLRRIYPCPGS